MPQPIPKRIIQTGKSLLQPLRTRAMTKSIRLLNPDCEYMFFDDEDVNTFVSENFPQHRAVFDAFAYPIQRYDLFRYLAVYHYGGFYFDTDVLLAESISPLLESGCVFPFEGLTFSRFLRAKYQMDWQIGNYAFGAAPKHPFLAAIIENCLRAQRDPAWVKPMMRGLPLLSKPEFFVLNTTGPGLISRTVAENPDLACTMKILFPDDVCDFEKWNRFGEFGIHLMDGSWRLKMGRWRRRLAQNWEARALQRLIRESATNGKTRCHLAKVTSV